MHYTSNARLVGVMKWIEEVKQSLQQSKLFVGVGIKGSMMFQLDKGTSYCTVVSMQAFLNSEVNGDCEMLDFIMRMCRTIVAISKIWWNKFWHDCTQTIT